MYNFGIYHWRRHLRTVCAGVLTLVAAAFAVRQSECRLSRFGFGMVAIGAGTVLLTTARKLLTPVPWVVGQRKYDVLVTALALDEPRRVLDVGSGTGRSVVGVASHLPTESQVTALDVFDDRIVLGNTPQRARANLTEAGVDGTVLAGDAARMPIRDESHDLVVVSRLLHDLPEATARRTLAEARRVLEPGGTLGILELPIVPGSADPEQYWRDLVVGAGFSIDAVHRPGWKDGRDYVVIAATPVEK